MYRRASLVALLLFLALPAAAQPYEPAGIYLTWTDDPTTTIVIDWHTLAGEQRASIQYRRIGAREWQTATADQLPYPHSSRTINRVHLTGLHPGTEHLFRIGQDGRLYRFRTMPETSTDGVRFAFGGDLMHEQEWFERVNRQVLKHDVDFIVIAGDLAYADGRPEQAWRWYDFFEAVRNTLVMEDGRVIPMLMAIGNHEVRGSYVTELPEIPTTDERRAYYAPFFFGLFAMPGHPGYAALDFGDYLSVFLLDTNHINEVAGRQTEWLEAAMRERQHLPHLIPAYHVPAFPSVRSIDTPVSQLVREHWVPLFERYGVRTAIEAHDHAYKRTHPIREGRIDPNGVVYVGDGAWGVSTREIGSRGEPPHERWYLANAQAVRHFIVMSIQGPYQHMLMVDEHGRVIDELPRTITSMPAD